MRCSELLHRRILPAARRSNILVYFARTPATCFIFVNRRRFLQYRIDNPPCFFDVVLPRKQCAVATYGVAEHPFIGIHLVCARVMARGQFHLLADFSVVNVHHGGAQRDGYLWADAKSPMIGPPEAMWTGSRRLA